MTYNLGVDVGGTFTDVIVFDEASHELTIDKVLSTPANPSEGVLHGIEEATAKADTSVAELDLLFHGTTVVTNMLLEETGARVGLLDVGGPRGHPPPGPRVDAWAALRLDGDGEAGPARGPRGHARRRGTDPLAVGRGDRIAGRGSGTGGGR